jgi:hypothetical protein
MTPFNTTITETNLDNLDWLYQFNLPDGRTAFIEPHSIDHSNPHQYHSFLLNDIRNNQVLEIRQGIITPKQAYRDWFVMPYYTNRNCFFQLVMPDLILDGWDIDELLKMEKEFDYSGHNAFKLYRNEYGHTCYDVETIDRNYTGIDGWYIGIIKDKEVQDENN